MVDLGATTTVHGLDCCKVTLTAWLAFGTRLSQVKSALDAKLLPSGGFC